MSFKQGLILGVMFLFIALAGSAGISYGVVELAGAEGPQGEQGPPGEQGPKGSKGAKGATGSSGSASQIADISGSIFRLTSLWALDTVIDNFNKTGFTSITDPQVEACRDYVLFDEGSFVECGFER